MHKDNSGVSIFVNTLVKKLNNDVLNKMWWRDFSHRWCCLTGEVLNAL